MSFCRLKSLINKAPVMLFMKGSKQVTGSVPEYIEFLPCFSLIQINAAGNLLFGASINHRTVPGFYYC